MTKDEYAKTIWLATVASCDSSTHICSRVFDPLARLEGLDESLAARHRRCLA